MMPNWRDLATAWLILCGALHAPGAESSSERVDRLHETLMAIGPELANQLKVARTDVESGSAEAGWTDEAKVVARAWLDDLVQPRFPVAAPPPVELRHPTRLAEVFRKSTQIPSAPPVVTGFALEVSARLAALNEVRGTVWFDYADATAMMAEEAWLDAARPADLAPAAKRLTRFKEVMIDPAPLSDPNRSERPFPSIGRTPGGVEVRLVGDQALSAFLVLSGPEPLILPDPFRDPKGYREVRMRWHNLAGWRMPFCERAAVSRRLMDYDQRYRAMAQKALLTLDRLLGAEARAEQLNEAMEDLESFRNPNPPHPILPANRSPFAPPPRANPAAPTPAGPSGFPQDYRAFLDRPDGARPGDITSPSYFRPAIAPETIDAYGAFITAVTSNSSLMPRKLPEATGKIWYRVSPALRAQLRTRYALDAYGRPIVAKEPPEMTPPSPVVRKNIFTPPRDAAAYDAVLASLKNVTEEGYVFIAAKGLLPSWQRLKDPKYQIADAETMVSSHWSTLATQPGGVGLITARDRAVLELLTPPGRAVLEGPALSALRARLEEALGDSNAAEMRRVLEIDRVAVLLPARERGIWVGVPEALETMRGTGSEAFVARDRVRQALSQVQSDAIAGKVARQLKSAR